MRTIGVLVIVGVVIGACNSSEKDKGPLGPSGAGGSAAVDGDKATGGKATTAAEDRKHSLDDVNIVATFDVHAEGANAPADGTLSLTKVRGEGYRGELTSGGKTYAVTGYRNGDLLALSWSETKALLGAASMDFFCDMSLEAHFAETSGSGKALITGGNSSFAGTWTVEKGTIPGESDTWSGRLEATAAGAVVTMAVKSASNGTNSYLLIRIGDVLGGGYRYDKKPLFAAHLRIRGGGASLDGLWVASTEASPVAMPLKLTRQGQPAPATEVALTAVGSAKTASGIACLDVPPGGHTLFPKPKSSK